jgi:hypothetical protein
MTLPSIFLNDDAPRARRTDSANSHAAADATTHKREHTWLLIEHALEANGPMTAQETVQYIRVRLGQWVSESRVTTSMKELRERGAISVTGERVNPSGYHATAYRIEEGD